MLDRAQPAIRSLQQAADTRADKQRAGKRSRAARSPAGPAALVESQVAEGSDRRPSARAGPAGTATLPLARARGSGSQIGGGAAIERAQLQPRPDPAPLSLAAESVLCNQPWWEEFTRAWRPAVKARSAPRVQRAAGRRHAERLAACGSDWKTLVCECGARAVPVRCRDRLLCPACKRAYYTRIRERMRDAATAAARAHPGWHWVHLRLSLRQVGTVEERRERWQRAWQRFRAWFRKRVGEAFPYCGCWEMTEGWTDAGNLHVHLLVLWPFIPYEDVHAEWTAATDGDSIPGIGSWLEGVSTSAQAIHYLTKYATKGVEPFEMPASLAGELLGAFYWRRMVQPSRGWWVPHVACCRDCQEPWVYVGPWERALVVERLGIDYSRPVGRGPPS